MSKFDRIEGQFVTTRLLFKDRFAFKRAKWAYDFRRKAWWTADEEKAILLSDWAIGSAKQYLDNSLMIRQAAIDASWAEDTDKEFPSPDGLEYMPFQKAGIDYCSQRQHTLLADEMGLGKSQPVTAKVLTPLGWTAIGELAVGDVVIGARGPTKVMGVYPQGIKDTYKISFSNGSSAYSSIDHLWNVRENGRRKRGESFQTKPLSEIICKGIKYSNGANKWDIPVYNGEGLNNSTELLISPYFMGILLGDGSFRNSSINFCVGDANREIVDSIDSSIDSAYRLREHKKEGNSDFYVVKKVGTTEKNIYNEAAKTLGLWNILGKDKFIPQEYMDRSIEDRKELLAGLLDSDGSVHKTSSGGRYHSNSIKLATGVQQLVWSLGGDSRIKSRTRQGRNTEYTVSIRLHFNPFKVFRKVVNFSQAKTPVKRIISSVDFNGKNAHVCIAVACPHHLYVTNDYTLTHNTIQAIGVNNHKEPTSVLVVCPASLKINWQREWEKWDVTGKTVGIVHSVTTTKRIDGISKSATKHVFPNTDVVIINYDVLDTYDVYIKSKNWGMVIFDEAHLLKTVTSIRTMCVFGGTRKGSKKKPKKEYKPLEADCHLYLTGTPILSRPVELWNIVKACDPTGLGASYTRYVHKYCAAEETPFGLDVSGASNLEELNRLMREKFMVRRDKKAVLKELPDMTREMILLPKDKLEAPIKKEKNRVEAALAIYETQTLGIDTSDVFRYIENIGTKIETALSNQTSEEPNWGVAVKTLSAPEQIIFSEISLAREEVALAKIGLVVEHVEKLFQCDEPVILFGYHKSVIKELQTRLEKRGMRVGVITGSVSPNKRQGIVDAFQNGELDVILGNIIAMGVGLTMTRGRFVVFAEIDWVPSLLSQAEARAWRKGQKNAVVSQYLMVDGSIESRMAIALLEKMGVIKEALD